MIDGLAAVFAGIDHSTIALGQSLLAGDLRYDQEQMSEQGSIFRFRFGE